MIINLNVIGQKLREPIKFEKTFLSNQERSTGLKENFAQKRVNRFEFPVCCCFSPRICCWLRFPSRFFASTQATSSKRKRENFKNPSQKKERKLQESLAKERKLRQCVFVSTDEVNSEFFGGNGGRGFTRRRRRSKKEEEDHLR